jgi:arylformamidase
VVGGDESAEYFRQSRTMTDAWAAAGLPTRYGTLHGASHFTAIAPLSDPASPMVMRLKELGRR